MSRPARPPVFQVGDRVRAIKESWGDEYAPVGATGTVEWCPAFPSVLPVIFDGHPDDGHGHGWAMFVSQVEHVHGPLRRRLRRAFVTQRGEGPTTVPA